MGKIGGGSFGEDDLPAHEPADRWSNRPTIVVPEPTSEEDEELLLDEVERNPPRASRTSRDAPVEPPSGEPSWSDVHPDERTALWFVVVFGVVVLAGVLVGAVLLVTSL